MPEQETIERARKDEREGKSPFSQAGEFVREEMEHIREGQHGARSAKQAIAIGLSKARRAGVKLPPPKRGKTSSRTRRQAERDLARGRGGRKEPSRTRSHATKRALRSEGHRLLRLVKHGPGLPIAVSRSNKSGTNQEEAAALSWHRSPAKINHSQRVSGEDNYFFVLLKCPNMILTLNTTSLLFTSTRVAPGKTAWDCE